MSQLASPITLTARERLLNALLGRPVDRVPVWLMRQAGRYLPEYQAVRKNYDFLQLCKTPSAAAEVSIQPIEIIGSDAVIIFNDIMLPLEAAGADVEFTEKGPRINNPVRSFEALSALRSTPIREDEPIVRTIQTVRERVGPDFPVLGFIGAPWTLATYWVEGAGSRNFERILGLRWSNPEVLDALLEIVTQVALDYLRIQIAAGANAVQIFDTWGSILRDADYERFSARWTRRIIESVRGMGAPVIFYMNGSAPYLPTLDTLGADCVSMDWRVSLSAARAALKTPASLQGNLDPLTLYSNPEAIDAAVADIFRDFPPRPGHVFNLGHGILQHTPVRNAQSLVEAVKRHGAC